MSVAIEHQEYLLDGGPPRRLQRSLGLIEPDDPRIARRAQLAVLVGWAPLVVLAIVESLILRNHVAASFFSDIAVQTRFLIAVPLLILAEAECTPRLGKIARQFVDADIIREKDRGRFDDAVASTQRLLNSKLAEVIVVVLAYGLVLNLMLNIPQAEFPAWQQSKGGAYNFSLAKLWHVFVSVPLLLLLLLGWLWRLLLWERFLWLTSRLDLRLIPGHPDLAGGLMFLNTSLRGFWLLSLALGTIAAGTTANLVMRGGATLTAFVNAAMGLVVFILILFVAPLLVFIRRLSEAKRRGAFEYGALAGEVGQQFERKWLNRRSGVDEGALDVPDFSSTTDLFQIVANVYEMQNIPLKLTSLAHLVVAAILPFVPVLLMVVPLKDVIEGLAKFLMK
jgi:hypothetical protein